MSYNWGSSRPSKAYFPYMAPNKAELAADDAIPKAESPKHYSHTRRSFSKGQQPPPSQPLIYAR